MNTGIAKGVKSYPDWCITIIYYAAVHYVDAKLAKMRMHPSNHYDRNPMVANNLSRYISEAYIFLQNRSESARYSPDSENKFSEQNVRECVDKLCVIQPKTSLLKFSTTQMAPFL
jgi:hypothetical protein